MAAVSCSSRCKRRTKCSTTRPRALFITDAFAAVMAEAGFPVESVDTVVISHIETIGMVGAQRRGGSLVAVLPECAHCDLASGQGRVRAQPRVLPLVGGVAEFIDRGLVDTIADGAEVVPGMRAELTGAHNPGHTVFHFGAGPDGNLARAPRDQPAPPRDRRLPAAASRARTRRGRSSKVSATTADCCWVHLHLRIIASFHMMSSCVNRGGRGLGHQWNGARRPPRGRPRRRARPARSGRRSPRRRSRPSRARVPRTSRAARPRGRSARHSARRAPPSSGSPRAR